MNTILEIQGVLQKEDIIIFINVAGSLDPLNGDLSPKRGQQISAAVLEGNFLE